MFLRKTSEIQVEQAVFGSFPFWDRGYDLLARSAACRPDWLAEFRAACAKIGERPRGVERASGLFAIRLTSGPWLIAGFSDAGRDDRGRPGALAFHGLFVADADYRHLDAWPFTLAESLRTRWGPDDLDRPLDSLRLQSGPDPSSGRVPGDDPMADAASAAILEGRAVVVESPSPIEELARLVWTALPKAVRARSSLATWTFAADSPFVLSGTPKASSSLPEGPLVLRADSFGLSGADPSRPLSDTPSETPSAPSTDRAGRGWFVPRWRMAAIWTGSLLMAFGAVGLGIASWWGDRDSSRTSAGDQKVDSTVPNRVKNPEILTPWVDPPGPDESPDGPNDPATRARVVLAIGQLADRFGIRDRSADPNGSQGDLTALTERIANRLRYRGPYLTADERVRLRAETAPGRARALEWDAHLRQFAPDRPLPSDFRRLSTRRQVDTLAWSFHQDLDPTLDPAEVVATLGHSLALDDPPRSNPLAERYPTLAEYEEFLRTLPSR